MRLIAIYHDSSLLARSAVWFQVCLERGWREYYEGTALRDHWNLWWRTAGHSASLYKQLRTWQVSVSVSVASGQWPGFPFAAALDRGALQGFYQFSNFAVQFKLANFEKKIPR